MFGLFRIIAGPTNLVIYCAMSSCWPIFSRGRTCNCVKKNLLQKGMAEISYLMKGGGACLHFWFKSSNFLAAHLISVRVS